MGGTRSAVENASRALVVGNTAKEEDEEEITLSSGRGWDRRPPLPARPCDGNGGSTWGDNGLRSWPGKLTSLGFGVSSLRCCGLQAAGWLVRIAPWLCIASRVLSGGRIGFVPAGMV